MIRDTISLYRSIVLTSSGIYQNLNNMWKLSSFVFCFFYFFFLFPLCHCLRALKMAYLTQDMIDDYEPALMFTIPRLAIVW